MLTLNTFGPTFGIPDASPFCIKAMCLLNMSGAQWQENPNSDSRKAPMQKLPVLIDGDQTVADSDSIRLYLQEKTGVDFDRPLSPSNKVVARALSRMVEEHLYFCLVFVRWKVDANWQAIKQRFFSELPQPARMLVPTLVRRSVMSSLSGQGIGRFSYSQMLERAEIDLSSIESFIGEGPFLFGSTAVSADASVGSVLMSIAANPAETGLRDRVRGSEILMNYIDTVANELCPSAKKTI